MRRSIPLLIASLALAPLALTVAPRARAEDAPEDQSPAAKAYRDAWWAETGGGNLTQALEGYTRAAEAEGPASLKARALYKKAVVLQRIGKTEEAIRTLERLAKEYPGEAAPQADARARLAEWTAVDLKTSFAEWYQRYQYSPEFQAKIVDLVLKLGSSDQVVGISAAQEILTIGAPAIPALRQHVESPNGALRERAVVALLRLGEVPSVKALRETNSWKHESACWATLRSANDVVRTRLRAEAQADQAFDQGLLAAFDGPAALLAWAGTPAAKGVSEAFLSYAFWWDQKQPESAAMRPLLLALVQDKTLSKPARSQVVYWLFSTKLVDAALAEAWAADPDPLLRLQGIAYLAEPRAAPDAKSALRRTLKLARAWEMEDHKAKLFAGILAGLDAAPAGVDLDGLADDLLAIWSAHIAQQASYPLSTSSAARAVLARMVDRARDPQVAVAMIQIWQRPGGGAEGDVDRLAGWVRTSPYEDVRQSAVLALLRVPVEGAHRAIAILAEPELSPDFRFTVFDYLLRSSSARSLLAEPTSRRALLSVLRTQEQADAQRVKHYVGRFLDVASSSGTEAQRATAMEWVADPASFPRGLLRSEYNSLNLPPHMARAWFAALEPVWPAWRLAWARWTPAQRDAAVEGIEARTPINDPEWVPFLRTIVLDASNGISKASRESLLRHIDVLSLDDLRAVYDLTTTKGTDDAVLLTFRKGARTTPELTSELFEALKLGLRPDGNDWIAGSLYKAFQHVPKIQRPLIEALLAHQAENIQESAIEILAARESTDDLPLWLKALALPSVDVRARAAAGLGRIAHPDATKALVAALDDPSSRVRDAAIASLEAIQKVEDLKTAWREKTEGRR